MSMAGDLLGEKNQEKLFNLLLKRVENQVCADCPTKAPTWVSLDFGVFVCMNCSAAHRRLSRSVTRVYSTKIDSWNKSNFQIMDYIGNEIANSYFEFKKPTRTLSVNSSPEERIRVVTEKYVKLISANPKSQNPVLTFLKQRERGILERPSQAEEAHNASGAIHHQINEKEFISTQAAGCFHREELRKQQSQLKEKRFSSVNGPTQKQSIDLLDVDNDYVAPKQLQKQKLELIEEDDSFANWMTAPTTTTCSSSASQNLATVNNATATQKAAAATTTTTSTNFMDFYSQQQGKQAAQVSQPQNFQAYQSAPVQAATQPTTFTQQHTTNNSANPTATQAKSVDLMSLYSQTSQTAAISSYGFSSQPVNVNIANNTQHQQQQQQQQQQQMQQQQQQIQYQQIQQQQQQMDKNRYQALNMMGQYNNNPYYQQQQQYTMNQQYQQYPQAAYQQQGYPQMQQWK